MKKIIISILTVAIGFSLAATSVHADAAFNQGSGLLPTITVDNVTNNPCSYGSVNGCWQTSTTAKPGDEIAAQISVANTSSETADNVTLSLQPSRNGTTVSFYGGGAATNAPRTTGTATVILSQAESVTELGGDQRADWRTNTNSTPQEVDISELFGSGFSIGNLAPGEQAVLTVRFQVNGTATNTQTCSINSFNANPSSIVSGNASSLAWTTTNCTSVDIQSVATGLSPNGSQTVSPTQTTTYTLIAYPGNVTKKTTVTVTNNNTGGNGTCLINNFAANPTSINLGSTSSLSWTTSNCNYVNVTQIGNDLATDSNGYTVSPTNTTTYTLTAYPGGATASATVTVNNVNTGGGTTNSCYINSFNASPSSITLGNSSTLSWNTTNCSYVIINPLSGNLPADGSGTVTPGNTTTYTLTAYPGDSTMTTTVDVYNSTNNNYCTINQFYVDSNSISQGQTTNLHWSTSGSNYVYITGFGNEPASGSLSISPYSSTNYELTMNGSNCTGNNSQSVYVTVNQPYYSGGGSTYVAQQPQAITTVASVLSSYSAQLNGIAVPNSTYGSATAWFSYGPTTSLGSSTTQQSVTGTGTYPYNANISGLVPGGTYYYQAVVQNQTGIAYGSVVPFTVPAATTYTPPTKVVYVQSQTVSHTSRNVGVVANSQPSLFSLQINSDADHMCIGGTIQYTVNYQNVSAEDLQNVVLRITFPGEIDYVSSSEGSYDPIGRVVTISLGDVEPGQQGQVTATGEINDKGTVGNLAVITGTVNYTNPRTQAQEQAVAYSLITISNDCPAVLGASVFGFGGFLPTTLLGWLLLILIILALVVLARSLYRRNEKPTA